MRFGARDLARRLRTELEPVLAEAMLAAPEASALAVDVQKGGWVVTAGPEGPAA
ncbi:hypothetical protein [Stutzerimonas tarimensis]|uniref:Clp ATPase C-terminal domain-containing protein n=1 Tax=Stutzerimonas tarimensis TaxID=1507735 RepID=A0ABV7T4E3_9GAMM